MVRSLNTGMLLHPVTQGGGEMLGSVSIVSSSVSARKGKPLLSPVPVSSIRLSSSKPAVWSRVGVMGLQGRRASCKCSNGEEEAQQHGLLCSVTVCRTGDQNTWHTCRSTKRKGDLALECLNGAQLSALLIGKTALLVVQLTRYFNSNYADLTSYKL